MISDRSLARSRCLMQPSLDECAYPGASSEIGRRGTVPENKICSALQFARPPQVSRWRPPGATPLAAALRWLFRSRGLQRVARARDLPPSTFLTDSGDGACP